MIYIYNYALNLKIQIWCAVIIDRMQASGHIQLILGPMFSGKSSQMQRKVRRFQHARKKCLVVNFLNDNRYSSQSVASTHDKLTINAVKTANLQEIVLIAMNYDVIAIDEGQFFNEIVEVSEYLANSGLIVIIAALDGTFQRKPFGNILNLIPMAQFVTKLSAVCIDCGQQAAFTCRTVDAQQIQLIGGQQSYKPVCRACFGLCRQKQCIKRSEQQKRQLSKSNNNLPINSGLI